MVSRALFRLFPIATRARIKIIENKTYVYSLNLRKVFLPIVCGQIER